MKKYIIQLVIGIVLSVVIIFLRMPQMEEGTAGVMMAVSDGFAVTGLLYVSLGVLFYASSTGFFDFFGYAFQRGASVIFPKFERGIDDYYEYKVKKQEERKKFSEKSTLVIGLVFVLISGIFTALWYQVI